MRVRADASPRCTRAARRSPPCTSPGSPPTCAARPGPTHFDGVTTVVTKLFAIVGAVRGVLRTQGRAAARGRHADGRRPRPAGRGGRLPDRARARRARAVEPQRVPLARSAPAPRSCSRGALGAAADAAVAGERDAQALVDVVRRQVVDRAAGRARVRRGRATPTSSRPSTSSTATCCSRSRPGSATPA